MNLASRKDPPLPSPLLHKLVEERELASRYFSSWEQLTNFFAGWVLSLTLCPQGGARESASRVGAVSRYARRCFPRKWFLERTPEAV
jgi:hypothetical protein